MFTTFKKAIATMLSLVFMLSLVPANVMAEVADDGSAIVRLSNGIFVRTDSSNSGNAQDYSTYLRAGSAYVAWFQLDFSGYEYLLRDDSSSLSVSLAGPQTSAKIVDISAYALKDSADKYEEYYTSAGLSYNDVKADLYPLTDKALEGATPLFVKSDATTTSLYTSDANKQVVIDALDASTDDSIVTFQLINGGKSSSYTNKGGFTHNHENTYIKINGAENATVEGYVQDVAEKITWDLISAEPAERVISALNLPTKYLGANIVWSSSNEDAVNSQTGEVTINPNASEYVTLTADITYEAYTGDTANITKEFEIKIPRDPNFAPSIIRISNPFRARTDSSNAGNAQDYSTYLRAGGSYVAWFQLDFTGYEYLLRDESSSLAVSLAGSSSSAKIVDISAYALKDSADKYEEYYTSAGLSYNDVKGDLYTLSATALEEMTPLFEKTTTADSVFTSAADKQVVIDALDASTDDSIVTFQLINGGKSSSYANKGGFSHTNENTFFRIDGGEDATVEGYVNDVADKLTWDVVSADNIKNISSNLALPSKFLGADVVWESTDSAINTETGEVTVNPEANTYVTLTANLTYQAYNGDSATATKEFNVRIPTEAYDYAKGSGTYGDGSSVAVFDKSTVSGGHIAQIAMVGGIAGKQMSDLCYEITDAADKMRLDLVAPASDADYKRDIIEFSICVPSDCAGYSTNIRLFTKADRSDDTSANSDLRFFNSGIYDGRSGNKLVSWNGDQWHHVAVVTPGPDGTTLSDGTPGYDRTVKIYVDGVLAKSIALSADSYPSPVGIKYVYTNGCSIYDAATKTFDRVSCYVDNIRWTNDTYVPEYNTLSAVESSAYDIDKNSGIINVVDTDTTIYDIASSLAIDEDATIRVYDAEGVLLEDDSQTVADGYTFVIADTNATTAERSFAYYEVRVIEKGEIAFNKPYVKAENGTVAAVVKLFNNTSAPVSYDVYIAVYSGSGRLLAVKPATLYVKDGESAYVETEAAEFEGGNIAKILVWEDGGAAPAIDQISFK